jgi:hypothetical protein
MRTLTARSCLFTCLATCLLTAGVVAGLNGFGTKSRVVGPAGTLQDPRVVRELVAEPSDAYRVWKKGGYRGRTLVFAAERWESFNPDELIPPQMFRPYPLELYNPARLLETEYLNGTTFLYVASMNRVVRGILAIVPEAEVNRMRKMAPKVKDSRTSVQGVFLSRQGFPRWFTTGANFAAPREPVLLYVGASYFKEAEPHELYRQLFSSGLRSDCLLLCREEGKEGVGPRETARLLSFARLVGFQLPAAGAGGKADSPAANRGEAP